jgi:hypothetical protein
VALDQGIPLSALYGEEPVEEEKPSPPAVEDTSGQINVALPQVSLPPASAGLLEADHPDVQKADVRSR